MGVLIRVLAHSPLARPGPAVSVRARARAGGLHRALCDRARHGRVDAAGAVAAHRTGAPAGRACPFPLACQLPIMNAGIISRCLGLALMLWANSRGWSPDPRRVFWTAAAVVTVLVNITPVGSSDVASYAAYGRIAALGHNPYVCLPGQPARRPPQSVHRAFRLRRSR